MTQLAEGRSGVEDDAGTLGLFNRDNDGLFADLVNTGEGQI